MELIGTLQESSSHAVGDLKKVLSKDARVKQVLQKDLDIDDVRNKAEFLQTLKFFVLNNRHVIQFAEERDYIKHLSKGTLKKLRELKVSELNQSKLNDVLDFVSALFREYVHVERSGMSPELRKELVAWANGNERYFDLRSNQQRELLTLPNVRPTRPTLLYRGLLFRSHDLKETKRYDGTLEVGQGLKFLRSVRDGTRVVDLEWDRASSWSTSKQTAMQFAKFGPASSNFAATLQWLGRKGHIDGDLGFIISTLAQPEDVLIDMNRLITAAHLKHGNEGEFILAPGSYTCRVSTKYTKEGEVDPVKSSQVDDSVTAAIEGAREFHKTWAFPDLNELREPGFNSFDADRLLTAGNTTAFVKLASIGIRTLAVEKFDEIREFYREHVSSLDIGNLESLLANKEVSKAVEFLGVLKKTMNGTARHADMKSEKNPRGDAKIGDMTGRQYRDSGSFSSTKYLRDATLGTRFTDSSVGSFLNKLARGLNVSEEKDIHRRATDVQQAFVSKIIAAFFEKIGEAEPSDKAGAVSRVSSAILGAERNARLLNSLSYLNDMMKEA